MAVHREQSVGVPHDDDATWIVRPGEGDFARCRRVHTRPGSVTLRRVPVFASVQISRQVPRIFRGIAVTYQEAVPEHATWLTDWVTKNQRHRLRRSGSEAGRQ